MNQRTSQSDELSPLTAEVLAEIEQTALDMARLAGSEITAALTRTLDVSYKTAARSRTAPTDPVSEIDYCVETLIRERLAQRFPEHGVIGEELDTEPESEPEFIWVIDPVDGTNNFINRFPLFAASIGVLQRGYPVAGAIWCSTSHELRPGVYHACRDGMLRFEETAVRKPNSHIKRRLAGDPGGPGSVRRTDWWDNRLTGSAAIECAFVAAGILCATRFYRPWIWDVAAGHVLVRTAGSEVWTLEQKDWVPLERFLPPASGKQRRPTLRDWNQPLILGTPRASEILRNPGFWSRLHHS